ncbi:MAG: efflux RND transporter periplasmic adaptor subunit [Flavobacterium sp.]|nr:MAG: efflux RND transporter periplasmic adaptor subunit [Flavobacterium sp.]
MKKIFLLAIAIATMVSCGKKDDKSAESIASSGNLAAMKEKRAALQAQIMQLDEAIAKLDTIKELALVSVAPVKDTVFNHYVEIQGNVDTKENLIIYPQFSGTLLTLNVIAGQKVSKGQVIGKIDDGGLSQQVAQLETQAALAKTTFERQKRLWDQKIGSEIQYLQAQTNMISQQKAVSQLRAQLARTVITAPISGVVDEIITERGQVVAPGQGIVRIVNLSNMYVSSSVPESYVGKLKVGTTVDVTLASLGKTYVGKIRQVANNINPSNRSFNIEVSVPNTDNLLRPNQVAQLKIIDYTNKNALVLPSNVVQEDGKGEKFVYVVQNISGKSGTAKKVAVKTGQTSSNYTEIVSGISADEIVVTEGASTLSEGMKVNF